MLGVLYSDMCYTFSKLFTSMAKNSPVSFEGYLRPLRSLSRWTVPTLFFLLPLAFSPFTSEALEMTKQVIMFVLVFLSALGLLGASVLERRFTLRGSWFMNLVPAVFLVAIFLSTIFSQAGLESWLGYDAQQYVSFLTSAVGVVLFYVLVNSSDTRLARQSLLALLLASSIIGAIVLLSLFGINILPFAFTKIVGFNTIGNVNALAAWLVPVSLVGLGFFLVDTKDEHAVVSGGSTGVLVRILIWFVAVVTLFLLIIIDFWTLWAAYMVGLASLMALSFLEPSHFPNNRRLIAPALLFVMATIFLFVRTPLRVQVPAVVTPSVSTSWDIAYQTVRKDTQNFLFGSGPGTFDLDYVQHRPVEINNTIFWNTRFDRAQIHPLTILATNGVLGFVSWIVLLIVILSLGLGRIARGRQETEWRVNYALLSGWVALLVLQLLSPANMSMMFLFWGLSGLLVAEAVTSTKDLKFSEAPRAALAVTAGFAAFAVLGLLTLFAVATRYSAEMAFAKAARMNTGGVEPQALVTQMTKAVSRDGKNPVYLRNLATAYLAQAGVVVGEGAADESFSDDDRQKLAQVADASIKAAGRALALGKNDSVNWAINGLIYREFMPYIQGAQDYAATMFTEALKLEPNNAAYKTDLGRVYLTVADRAQQIQDLKDATQVIKDTAAANEKSHLETAVNLLNDALRLKPDYAPAHYYLAAAYERQDKLEDAANRLKSLTEVSPNDSGLGFQLAVIYIKMEKLDDAEKELQRVLEIDQNYSNAMWYLAAIKANRNQAPEALALLRRIEKLNPDNTTVKQSISTLEAGGTTATEPSPLDTTQPRP
jgi:tetratricopeptide (TPR) repeat protein